MCWWLAELLCNSLLLEIPLIHLAVLASFLAFDKLQRGDLPCPRICVRLLLSHASKEANRVALHPFSEAKNPRGCMFLFTLFVVRSATFQAPLVGSWRAGQRGKSASAVLYC